MTVAAVLLALISPRAGAQPDEDHSDKLRVHFVDVGHGDCIFIETPNLTTDEGEELRGPTMLIDAGKQGRGKRFLIPYMRTLGYEAGDVIDYVVATHAHDDHIGGLPEVYDTFQVNVTLDPGYYCNKTRYRNYNGRAAQEPESEFYFGLVEAKFIKQIGDTFELADGVAVRVLHSNPELRHGDPNHNSIILRLTYGDVSFLFAADGEGKHRDSAPGVAPEHEEKYLLDRYTADELRSTVLKVPHHGSETSSTQRFIDAVRPKYAVVMAGRGSYGSNGVILPDETVIQRYEAVADSVFRTDLDDGNYSEGEAGGDDHILMVSDGETVTASYVAISE